MLEPSLCFIHIFIFVYNGRVQFCNVLFTLIGHHHKKDKSRKQRIMCRHLLQIQLQRLGIKSCTIVFTKRGHHCLGKTRINIL